MARQRRKSRGWRPSGKGSTRNSIRKSHIREFRISQIEKYSTKETEDSETSEDE